jgi:hypothetical protein
MFGVNKICYDLVKITHLIRNLWSSLYVMCTRTCFWICNTELHLMNFIIFLLVIFGGSFIFNRIVPVWSIVVFICCGNLNTAFVLWMLLEDGCKNILHCVLLYISVISLYVYDCFIRTILVLCFIKWEVVVCTACLECGSGLYRLVACWMREGNMLVLVVMVWYRVLNVS